jgi:hypothetical protein
MVPPSCIYVPEDPNAEHWNYVKFCDRVNIDWSLQGSEDDNSSNKIYELRLLVSLLYLISLLYMYFSDVCI